MDAREKLDEFANLRGLNKNQPLGWSVASDFAEWYAEQVKICVVQSEQLKAFGKSLEYKGVRILTDEGVEQAVKDFESL